jgi:hypothetical protein
MKTLNDCVNEVIAEHVREIKKYIDDYDDGIINSTQLIKKIRRILRY